MSISYQRDGRAYRRQPTLMVVLMFVNALFALAILTAWTQTSNFIVDPIAWATWMSIYRRGTVLDIFEYPFIVLWITPVGFIGLAWISEKLGARSLAWTCVWLPIVMHGVIAGWYYLLPAEWR